MPERSQATTGEMGQAFTTGTARGLEARATGAGEVMVTCGEQPATQGESDDTPQAIPLERCPFVAAQGVLQGKWAILILHHLADGPLRFNQLRARMPQVTHATLSNQLKALGQRGMVRREVFPEVPPRVEYSLTPIGERFRPVLDAVEVWGNEYLAWEDEDKGRNAENV